LYDIGNVIYLAVTFEHFQHSLVSSSQLSRKEVVVGHGDMEPHANSSASETASVKAIDNVKALIAGARCCYRR